MASRAHAAIALAPAQPAAKLQVVVPAGTAPSTFFSSSVIGDDFVEVTFNHCTPEGLVARSNQPAGYACTPEEADLLISILRDGTDYLPTWQAQLAAAGFVRQFPKASAGSPLSCRWHDASAGDSLEITVRDGFVGEDGLAQTSVDALHVGADKLSMQNICGVTDNAASAIDDAMRYSNLPEGIDAAKAGVAAALAIRAARKARNASAVAPLD